ncbi:MAG: hypothetical protein M1831_006764 [Alyxoria varia]|nr:MAG: hypothetical protein M1831_006764 [Alyxoria varia]
MARRGEFSQVLLKLGMSDYEERFVTEGFDNWQTLSDITEADLIELDVKLGHRRKLQRAIAEDRGQASHRPIKGQSGALNAAGESAESREGSGAENGPDGHWEGRNSYNRPKRKYKRHPKVRDSPAVEEILTRTFADWSQPDLNAPERPASAYVLFSNHVREEYQNVEVSFTAMAKIVGEKWQTLESEDRAKFEHRAAADKEQYRTALAEYKKTPEFAEYQEYVKVFKQRNNDGKKGRYPAPKCPPTLVLIRCSAPEQPKKPKIAHSSSAETQSSNDTNIRSVPSPQSMTSTPSESNASYEAFPKPSFSPPATSTYATPGQGSYLSSTSRVPSSNNVPNPSTYQSSGRSSGSSGASMPDSHMRNARRAPQPESARYAPIPPDLSNESSRSPRPLDTPTSPAASAVDPSRLPEDHKFHLKRTLPVPYATKVGNTSSAPADNHFNIPASGESPRNRTASSPLDALLRAGELAREADSSISTSQPRPPPLPHPSQPP